MYKLAELNTAWELEELLKKIFKEYPPYSLTQVFSVFSKWTNEDCQGEIKIAIKG